MTPSPRPSSTRAIRRGARCSTSTSSGSLAAAGRRRDRASSRHRAGGSRSPSFAAILALSVLVGFVRRLATHYTITDRRLHIRRGILSRTEQHTTIDRVQNVETHQTLLERVLRIGTVNFDTAATDDSDFKFEGVASPRQVVAAVDRGAAGAPLRPPPAARRRTRSRA